MKYTFVILAFILSCLFIASAEESSIQDYLEVKDVLLLPQLNNTINYANYRYDGNTLFLVDNYYQVSADSAAFRLYTSTSNHTFDSTLVKIPNSIFHNHYYIVDVYDGTEKFYFLEFDKLLICKKTGSKIEFERMIRLKRTCNKIESVGKEIRLSNNIVASNNSKFNSFDLLYSINIETNEHVVYDYKPIESKFFVNVGPRNNFNIINGLTAISSDITSYSFNIMDEGEDKKIVIDKPNWNNSKLEEKELNNKEILKKSNLLDLSNYDHSYSTVKNVFYLDSIIITEYTIFNVKMKPNIYYDILVYDSLNKELKVEQEYLQNTTLNKEDQFNWNKYKFGSKLSSNGKYLLDRVTFPFKYQAYNITNAEMEKKIEEYFIDNKLRYSIIVREVK